MKGIWVVLFLALTACAPGVSIESLADANPDSIIAVNKLSGDDAKLFFSSLAAFCGDVTADPVYRVQIVSQNKTITKAMSNNKVLCEVDSSDPEYIEKSVAVLVNKEPIYLKEIQDAVAQIPEEQRVQALNDMIVALINQKILTQKAEEQGVSIQDIITQITEAVIVTDEETRQYYDDNKADLVLPPAYNVRHIQINLGDKDPASVKKKADTVMGLLATTDFCELAEQFSEDESTARDCGRSVFSPEQLVPAVRDALQSMAPGETQLVETEAGFHILTLDSLSESRTAGYSEIKESIEQFLLLQKQQEAFNDYLSVLREDSEIVSYLT